MAPTMLGLITLSPSCCPEVMSCGPVYLYAVDVDGVLVVCASSHGVLARHLVVGVHARQGGEHRFHRTARGIGGQRVGALVDGLHLVGLFAEVGDLDFMEGVVLGAHLHAQRHVTLRVD